MHIVQCRSGGSGGRMRRELCRGYRNIGTQKKPASRPPAGLYLYSCFMFSPSFLFSAAQRLFTDFSARPAMFIRFFCFRRVGLARRYNIRAGITPLLPLVPLRSQQHTTRPAWVYCTRGNMRHGHAPIVASPAVRQWYIFP